MQGAVESLGEGDLLVVREGLVAEHQDTVAVHAGTDRLKGFVVVHGAQVDRTGFRREEGMKRSKRKRHDVAPLSTQDKFPECGL